MPDDYFEIFCEQQGIHLEQRNATELNKIAKVCFDEISQDRRYSRPDDLEGAFNYYLELLHTYTEKFLPNVSAEIPTRTLNGYTVLQYAALQGFDRYISGLSHVVDINAADAYGMSPVHLAAAGAYLKTLEALCALGANCKQENQNAQLPLYCVLTDPNREGAPSYEQQSTAFHYLLSCYPEGLAHIDIAEQNVAHLMAVYGHKALLEEVIQQDRGVVLNKNSGGIAPIHAAILNHQPALVKLILDKVPEAALLTGHQLRLPLHVAVLAGDVTMVRYCCEANHTSEVMNAQDSEGSTPWMMATASGNPDLLALLDTYPMIDKADHTRRQTQRLV